MWTWSSARPALRGRCWFRLVYASQGAGPPRIRPGVARPDDCIVGDLTRTVVVDDDHHHGRRAGLPFYAFLASRSDEPFGLEAVVEGLRAALEDDGSDRWRHAASDHARRRRVIDAYRNEWPAHKIGLFADIDEASALAAAVSAPVRSVRRLLPRSALAPRLVEALEAGTCGAASRRSARAFMPLICFRQNSRRRSQKWTTSPRRTELA